jgi:ABC-type antimicrobial peptide transport system permease subunit
MGIRISLGAAKRQVVDLVLTRELAHVALGLLLGVVLSLALGKFVQSLLFGVTADDPAALIGGVAVFAAVAVAAGLAPALRAARVDPMDALRAD